MQRRLVRSKVTMVGSVVALVLTVAVVQLQAADAAPEDNRQIAQLFKEDQSDRLSLSSLGMELVAKRDTERRLAAFEAFRRGELRTAADFFRVGLIYQHGVSLDDSRAAYAFASLALLLDGESRAHRGLVAAAWDRQMVMRKRPQWYGTQFRRESDGSLKQYETDWNATSDEEKIYFGVHRPGSEPWLPAVKQKPTPMTPPPNR